MEVSVRDNDVNGALRVLKKKMQREGIFREMKRRRGKTVGTSGAGEGRGGAPSPQDVAEASRARGVLK